MDLLNLSDGIFREFVHTPDMDSRCAHHPARPHLRSGSRKWADTRSELSTWPVSRLSGEVIGTLKRCSQKANPGSPAKSRVVFSDTWREQPIQPDTDYRS